MRPIDADALKNKAQKISTEAWKMNLVAKVETTLNQFIDWIEEQPTIDAVPVRHGKWITEEGVPGVAVCSNCGHEIRGMRCQYTRYCEECGAYMRGNGS